jgi:ABC-type nickel/cobalt efflux system permease component RcnA
MPRGSGRLVAGLAVLGLVLAPAPGATHPLGNFSISQYGAIRIGPDRITVRYLVDLAEIPTFQELQDTALPLDPADARVRAYLDRKVAALRDGLIVELDGRRLELETESTDILFPPGVGGLPTMKAGALFRAVLPGALSPGPHRLDYRDRNFPDRVGWKEIIAVAAAGVTLTSSTAPARDRSQELTDYPTDLLNSPPQDLEARVAFTREPAPAPVAAARPAAGDAAGSPGPPSPGGEPRAASPPAPAAASTRPPAAAPAPPASAVPPGSPPAAAPPHAAVSGPPPPAAGDGAGGQPGAAPSGTASPDDRLDLRPNRHGSSRSGLADLVGRHEMGPGFVALALLVAAGLGAFHALEPGHGKTVVAAYLVGSRGTAWHALWLGLIVTAAHTAGVYLLGALTLYASRYVVPERLYPWLGVVSGLIVAALGFTLFLRRYAAGARLHDHGHAHAPDVHHHEHHHEPEPALAPALAREERGRGLAHHAAAAGPGHDHAHAAGHAGAHAHGHDHVHGHGHHHGHGHGHSHAPVTDADGRVSASGLVALGVSGGLIPCPAAIVVLLTAVSLNRIGFGFLLIVAFSIGLAAVLVAIGVLMVQARRVVARFGSEESPLIQRWLPLTSSAVMTLLGIAIAVQALVSAGIVQIRL